MEQNCANQEEQPKIVRPGLEVQYLSFVLVDEIQAEQRDEKAMLPTAFGDPSANDALHFDAKQENEQRAYYEYLDIIVCR